jgi:hypothetical protein
MVSTNIYNRSEIKQNLISIFGYVNDAEYIKAKQTSDRLLHSLLVYYKTRGVSANHFYELFDWLNYYLLYATNNNFKKRIVMDQLEKISNEIRTSTKDPMDRLREIFNEIRHLYYTIGENSTNELVDCFDELEDLKPEFERLGGVTFNHYSQMMKQVGICESILLKINKGKITDTVINTLGEAFSNFFQSVHQVLSPPVKLEISAEEIYRKVKEEDVPLEIISTSTGQPYDDLRALLQAEELKQQQELFDE